MAVNPATYSYTSDPSCCFLTTPAPVRREQAHTSLPGRGWRRLRRWQCRRWCRPRAWPGLRATGGGRGWTRPTGGHVHVPPGRVPLARGCPGCRKSGIRQRASGSSARRAWQPSWRRGRERGPSSPARRMGVGAASARRRRRRTCGRRPPTGRCGSPSCRIAPARPASTSSSRRRWSAPDRGVASRRPQPGGVAHRRPLRCSRRWRRPGRARRRQWGRRG